jgi:hypothetical protein
VQLLDDLNADYIDGRVFFNGGCSTSLSNHHTMVKEPITVKVTTFFLPKSGTTKSMAEKVISASLHSICYIICHN